MKVKFSLCFDFRYLCSVVFVLILQIVTSFCSNNNGLFHYLLLEIFHISNFYFEIFFLNRRQIFCCYITYIEIQMILCRTLCVGLEYQLQHVCASIN